MRSLRLRMIIPVLSCIYLLSCMVLSGCAYGQVKMELSQAGERELQTADRRLGAEGTPDATPKTDFRPYLADLQRRVKRAWFPPKARESERTVVFFKIHKGGELSNLRLERTSGRVIADQAALKAVENASPFRPLPTSAPDAVGVQFVFTYDVLNGHADVDARLQ